MSHTRILLQHCPMKALVPDWLESSESAPQSVSSTNNSKTIFPQAVRDRTSHLAEREPCETVWPLGGLWIGRRKILLFLWCFPPVILNYYRLMSLIIELTPPKKDWCWHFHIISKMPFCSKQNRDSTLYAFDAKVSLLHSLDISPNMEICIKILKNVHTLGPRHFTSTNFSLRKQSEKHISINIITSS